MRKYLLPEKGNFYKANLHSHSNLSDGRFSPEEMREYYKNNGYSILAISDHDALHCNYHLTEPDFLVMTAYEISIRSDDINIPHSLRKVVDLNLLSKQPYNTTQVGYHPESVQWLVERGKMTQEEVDAIEYAGELRDMHYYPANVKKIIKSAVENGFLVTINHPTWSLMNYNDYANFEGAWAIEVYNHACACLAGLNDSENIYEDILRTGKNIYAVATDDNHSHRNDSFGGFTMIKSEKLDYQSIIEALENGHFYASTGPEIKELYYEEGKIHLTCSEASEVSMLTLGRIGKRVAGSDGEPITEAVFDVEKDFGYVRFRVVDKCGKRAYTNAYYVDEFEPTAVFIRAVL